MKEIRGDAKNLRSLLGGAKFAIDYYQREYRWEKKQVAELIDDLAGKFLESYERDHERTEVENYGHYFLGSIIISVKQNQKYIIDGQQQFPPSHFVVLMGWHSGADGRLADRLGKATPPGGAG